MTKYYGIFTVDPKNPTGKKIEVFIPSDLALRWYKYNPVKHENLKAVKDVLDDPKRIYSGIRVISEGGFCYVGRPEKWCIKEDIEAPFPGDRIFAVYLNNKMRVYDFMAEYINGEDPLGPKDWKHRFMGLLWRSTS